MVYVKFGTVFVTAEAYNYLLSGGGSLTAEEYVYAYLLGGEVTDEELRGMSEELKEDADSLPDDFSSGVLRRCFHCL